MTFWTNIQGTLAIVVVDAHDGRNAGDVLNWPNKRAPTRLMA
jgi:hypothetical protein